VDCALHEHPGGTVDIARSPARHCGARIVTKPSFGIGVSRDPGAVVARRLSFSQTTENAFSNSLRKKVFVPMDRQPDLTICPHCHRKLRVRSSYKQVRLIQQYRECRECDYRDKAIVEPAKVLRVHKLL
jgi:hypothetical protein